MISLGCFELIFTALDRAIILTLFHAIEQFLTFKFKSDLVKFGFIIVHFLIVLVHTFWSSAATFVLISLLNGSKNPNKQKARENSKRSKTLAT